MWTASEAEAWILSVSREQTQSEVGFLTWAFERFSPRKVRRVLDLGCGTGRIGVELAAQGYGVTGVDKFETMLSRAKRIASQRHVRLDLVQTPLDELRGLNGKFDAAYSIQDPFNYLLKEEEVSRALARIRSLLRPEGLLVIDMMNFTSLYGRWKRVIRKETHGDNWSIRRKVEHEVDDVNMLWYHKVTNLMKLNGKTSKWKETHVLRMWTYPEMSRLLTVNGFRRPRLFGGLEAKMEEATTSARRLVIIANNKR